jgi:hypothetical protein
MKTLFQTRLLLLICLLLAGVTVNAQTSSSTPSKTTTMKMYLIERAIPDAGKFTPEDLKAISQTSCGVLDGMGPRIKWIHSYVTGNHIHCIYEAENEDLIREHGTKGGFPVTNIMEISAVISPATAKS